VAACAGLALGLTAHIGYQQLRPVQTAASLQASAATGGLDVKPPAPVPIDDPMRRRLRELEAAAQAAEQALATARADLDRLRADGAKIVQGLNAQLAEEKSARGKSEAALEASRSKVKDLEAALAGGRSSSQAAVSAAEAEQSRIVEDLRRQVDEHRQARESAELQSKDLQDSAAEIVEQLENRVRVLEANLKEAEDAIAAERRKGATATDSSAKKRSGSVQSEPAKATAAKKSASSGEPESAVPAQPRPKSDPEPWEYSSPLWQGVRTQKEQGN
jgi:chromosome segregation ATPase